jgi:alginate O-acetyltransferase complex protein AlgI
MLFNSYSFIFLFLPITFFGMLWLGKHNQRLAALWLFLASFFFYAAWDTRFALLLLCSITFNYGAGYWIIKHKFSGRNNLAKKVLLLAILTDLCLLGYFKYANFFIESVNAILGNNTSTLVIILPLGVSFFTFTQIAYIVDAYRGITRELNFINYLLFVTWFPHLIAGPVIHHKQIMPQFTLTHTFRINHEHVAVGLTIFILGLAKKVLLADNLSDYANPVFTAASEGHTLMLIEAWIGALAYTLQLYFDFSGYSDMAIGLSLMFNVRLPLNFNSPYKATSIIEFWRRWHMTLSTFLREYLYIPMGGNRKGTVRRYGNLMATMLLGGLWHGAGWSFVVWGGLHGFYLMVNHSWRELKSKLGWHKTSQLESLAGGALTFLAVVAAWVVFRADSFTTATEILKSMAGMRGISLSASLESLFDPDVARNFNITFMGLFPNIEIKKNAIRTIAVGLLIIWLFPNVREIMHKFKPTWDDFNTINTDSQLLNKSWLSWKPSSFHAIVIAAIFYYSFVSLTKVSEFLYFQF